MQKSGETVEFIYNENGLRMQKTATSTGVTKYTLHGKNIVHMTQGSNELHFFYDAQNKPAVVVYNGTPYTYVNNLQGDIVAILDSYGIAVVQYRYDAWDRQISCDVAAGNSNAAALSTLNPFRYRGYVYDEETKQYYLRSRYYSSVIQRFINSDVLCGNNQYTYCKNSPVVLSDNSGYACVRCFDENGLETSLMTQFAMGGGGGGAYAATSVAMSFDKDKDTSKEYALYDNHRFNDDSVFHEQIGVITVNEPSLDLPSIKGAAGFEFDLMTGGWEWGNDEFAADLSLLDIGHAELGGSFSLMEGELKGTAMVSCWSPSVSVKLFGIEISIGAEIGAIGAGVDADIGWGGGISLKGAFGLGFNLGIDW